MYFFKSQLQQPPTIHASSKVPNLYLLMTPLSVKEEELQYGSMNHVLSGGLQWYGEKSLEAEDAVLAFFFCSTLVL